MYALVSQSPPGSGRSYCKKGLSVRFPKVSGFFSVLRFPLPSQNWQPGLGWQNLDYFCSTWKRLLIAWIRWLGINDLVSISRSRINYFTHTDLNAIQKLYFICVFFISISRMSKMHFMHQIGILCPVVLLKIFMYVCIYVLFFTLYFPMYINLSDKLYHYHSTLY